MLGPLPLQALMQKGLTLKSGMTSMQRYWPLLLQLIQVRSRSFHDLLIRGEAGAGATQRVSHVHQVAPAAAG